MDTEKPDSCFRMIDDISKDVLLVSNEFSYKIGMIHDKIGMAFNYIFFRNLYKQLIYEYD